MSRPVIITPESNTGSPTFNSRMVFADAFAFFGLPNKAPATYASVTGKWVTPWKAGDLGAYISGELGHRWIRAAWRFLALGFGYTDPSYTYGNIGLAFTWRRSLSICAITATMAGVLTCASFLVSAVGNPSKQVVGSAFIVALKFQHHALGPDRQVIAV